MMTPQLRAARARGPHPPISPWVIVWRILRARLIILGGLMLACVLALAALAAVKWVIRTPPPPASVTIGAEFVFMVVWSFAVARHLRTGRWPHDARYRGVRSLLAEVGISPLIAALMLAALQIAFVLNLIKPAPLGTAALILLCISVTDAALVSLALSLEHGAQQEIARLRDEVHALQEERDGRDEGADYHDQIWSSGA